MAKMYAYAPVAKMTQKARTAHFLDWAAKHHPNVSIPLNAICQSINGYARMPTLKNDEVERLRKYLGGVRLILREVYGRELVNNRGVGARATVDDADKLATVVPKAVRKLDLTVKNVKSIVKPIQLTNLPVGHPMRAYFKNDVNDLVAKLNDASFVQSIAAALPASARPLTEVKAEARKVKVKKEKSEEPVTLEKAG